MTKGQKTIVGVLAAIGAVFGLRKLAEAAPPPIIPPDEPLPPECRDGDTICHGDDLHVCVNGRWVLAVAQSEACIIPAPPPEPPPSELWVCSLCGAEFDTRDGLEAHLLTHCPGLVRMYCWDCGAEFDVTYPCGMEINETERTGTVLVGGIPPPCSQCGSTNLHEEPYMEPGPPLWVCPECGEGFATIQELATHLDSIGAGYNLIAQAAQNRGAATEADVQACRDWWLEGKMEMSDVLTVVNVQLHPA